MCITQNICFVSVPHDGADTMHFAHGLEATNIFHFLPFHLKTLPKFFEIIWIIVHEGE